MDNRAAISRSHRKHVTWRLRATVRVYFAISIVLAGFVIYHIVEDGVSVLFPILGALIGIAIGLIAARISHISWDTGAKQVISRFDEIGALILVLYILFDIFKGEVIEHFVHGPAVIATSTALLTGIMVGRVYGMTGKITRVLQEQNKPNDQLHLLH